MSGNMVGRIESDPEEDEVFMGPITKRELLAPMKKKVKSHPKPHPVQVSTPRVIDSINLVTPAKSSACNGPLDLSMKISNPEVIDLSSSVHNTILVPDTPGCRVNKSSMFNDSDFMDESELNISVDGILVDLNRDIETEMENDVQEIQNKKAVLNQSVTSNGLASQNQSLHLQSFFNNTQNNGTAADEVVANGSEKHNATLPNNDGTQVLNGDQTVQVKHNATIVNTDAACVLAYQSMNASHASHILVHQEINVSHILNDTSADTQRNTTRNSLNPTTNQMNVSKNGSQNGLENAYCSLSQRKSGSLSMNGSELHNVLDSTVETSMMSSRELSTEDSNPHQDVLSESFQYYTGEELNKENDLNQSNHLVQKSSPVSVKHDPDTDLNETFEKLSMSYSKSGYIHNEVPPNSAEDTLEEIDILETYGYKVKDKLSIPTINILSATIVEEEDATGKDRKSNNFSVSIKKHPNTSQLENTMQELSSSLNHSLAQEKLKELMNKSVCEESNEKDNSIPAHEDPNKDHIMSEVEILYQDTMTVQNMSVADIPDLNKSSTTPKKDLHNSIHVNNRSSVVDQEESNDKDISQILANMSIQATNESVCVKSTKLNEDDDMETSKLGEDPNFKTSNINKSALIVDLSKVNQSSDSSMPFESVVYDSMGAVDVIGRDSCVGLCETVNDIQEESIVSPPSCLEFNAEPDDLNCSIIDNSDATNHWKEVNSAHNTYYVDLSPIKKNASGETDGFDFSTAATLGSDHTYAHGDPSSGQFSHLMTRSEPSSSTSEDEIVQDVMFVNMSTKKLLSIREENESVEKEDEGRVNVKNGGDEREIEHEEEEMDSSDSGSDEIVVQEVVDVGIEDEVLENFEDDVEVKETDLVIVENQGKNLNATFAKENEEKTNVSDAQDETSTYESALKTVEDMNTTEKSMSEDITKDWKKTSLEGDFKETDIPIFPIGTDIDKNKEEIYLSNVTNSTENVIEKVNDSDAENTLPVEKSLLAESLKKANEQMQELNAELNGNQIIISEKMDQDSSVHNKSALILEPSHEKANINKTNGKDAVALEGNSTMINEVTHQSVVGEKKVESEEAGQRTDSNVIPEGVKDSIEPFVNEKSAIMETMADNTQKTDHCNNTHLANKVVDECDFKALVQKYEETTGASLSTTNPELSFAPEFSKPRQINDALNVSSPELEVGRKDTNKSTIKPSQIPMCRRNNVLRPTKFTAGDSIKLPSKTLAQAKSREKAVVNGTFNASQREAQAKKPDPKTSTPTPLTPRSISRTLMSSFSSLANRITGRTPKKDTIITSKLKSPEVPKPNAIKSPKPLTLGLKPTKSGGTSGIKSPNSSLKPFSAADKAFSPIMARFRNVPSSTPAVKNMSKTPTPRQKVNKTPGNEDSMGKQIRKSLSASKVEGQHKTLNKSSGFDSSLNNRKLDFKNVESKIGSIRKPDEIPALQKAVKSPTTNAGKPSLIKPPKFTSSKLPSLAPNSLPTKRPSKFLNVQSPIGAYIRDGTKATQESKRGDSSFIPRKLQKLNSNEGQTSTANPAVKVVAESNKKETKGNSVPVSADVSMTDTPALTVQPMCTSNVQETQHTAL